MGFLGNFSLAMDALRGNLGSFMTSSFLFGNGGAVWIDTTKPKILYKSIPQLKTVIDRDAAMFSNMVLKIVDKDGKEIDDPDFKTLIQNPNPLQSMNEWLMNYKQQLNVYGNQFMYMNKPSNLGAYPVSIMNISPEYLQVISTGKVFDQVDIKGIIKEYRYPQTDLNGKKIFKVDEIMFTRIPDVDNPLVGCGNIESLKFPASNIQAAYKYLNVIDNELGGIGIFRNRSKDAVGHKPLKDDEKKALQSALTTGFGNGPGQKKHHFTDGDLEFQPISYPVADMLLLEQIDHYYLTIIDSFKHSPFLYSNKNGTYENVKNGIIQTYQDAIFPAADLFSQSLTKSLKFQDGKKIIASFEHLEIIKQNKLQGMSAIESMVRSLTQAVDANILKPVQATSILQNELNIISPEA